MFFIEFMDGEYGVAFSILWWFLYKELYGSTHNIFMYPNGLDWLTKFHFYDVLMKLGPLKYHIIYLQNKPVKQRDGKHYFLQLYIDLKPGVSQEQWPNYFYSTVISQPAANGWVYSHGRLANFGNTYSIPFYRIALYIFEDTTVYFTSIVTVLLQYHCNCLTYPIRPQSLGGREFILLSLHVLFCLT